MKKQRVKSVWKLVTSPAFPMTPWKSGPTPRKVPRFYKVSNIAPLGALLERWAVLASNPDVPKSTQDGTAAKGCESGRALGNSGSFQVAQGLIMWTPKPNIQLALGSASHEKQGLKQVPSSPCLVPTSVRWTWRRCTPQGWSKSLKRIAGKGLAQRLRQVSQRYGCYWRLWYLRPLFHRHSGTKPQLFHLLVVCLHASSFLFFLSIYFLFYCWLHWVFLLCAGFLQLWQAGATLQLWYTASHRSSFSCCGADRL